MPSATYTQPEADGQKSWNQRLQSNRTASRIRPDKSDPLEVLGILSHELVHSAVPLGSGHGPVYKALATKFGLEGKMRHAMPGGRLAGALKLIAEGLGPLPHATLNLEFRESAPRKKQKTNMLKATCPGVDQDGKHVDCDYVLRVTKTHAERGAPFCGVHEVRMNVEFTPDDEPDNDEENGGEVEQPAPVAASREALKPVAPPAADHSEAALKPLTVAPETAPASVP